MRVAPSFARVAPSFALLAPSFARVAPSFVLLAPSLARLAPGLVRLLAEVPHRQVVLAVPKRLRPYFLYHRSLLGDL